VIGMMIGVVVVESFVVVFVVGKLEGRSPRNLGELWLIFALLNNSNNKNNNNKKNNKKKRRRRKKKKEYEE